MALRYITCGSQSSAQSTPLAAKHWLRQDQGPTQFTASKAFFQISPLSGCPVTGRTLLLVGQHSSHLPSQFYHRDHPPPFPWGLTSHMKSQPQCQSWSHDQHWSIHMAHLSIYGNESMGWSESQVRLLRPNLVVSCESEFSTPFGCLHVSSQLLDGWDIFLYKPVKTQKMSILFCMSLPRSKKHLTGSHQQKSLHPVAKNGVTCLPHQIISKEMLYN